MIEHAVSVDDLVRFDPRRRLAVGIEAQDVRVGKPRFQGLDALFASIGCCDMAATIKKEACVVAHTRPYLKDGSTG